MVTAEAAKVGSALKYRLLGAGCLRQVTNSSLNLLNKVGATKALESSFPQEVDPSQCP
jgi:hypothetical protein